MQGGKLQAQDKTVLGRRTTGHGGAMGVFVVYASCRRRRSSKELGGKGRRCSYLQNDKLARPDGQNGKQGEADDEAGERAQIASSKDEQSVPPTHC